MIYTADTTICYVQILTAVLRQAAAVSLKYAEKQTLFLRLTQRILEYDDWNVSSYWKRIVLV